MPPTDPYQGLLPSVVDRLIDPESQGTSWQRGYDMEQMIDAIRRDLEELLNAHPSYHDLTDKWPELQNSILTFGMPDLMSVTVTTLSQREEIGRVVERVIGRFEPRLRNIRAVLVESPEGMERDVRFHIDAEINADPAPAVAFETILELTTGQTKIEASRI
jgi:type VI secretion system protein ImpF